MYTIELAPKAERALKKIAKDLQRRIIRALLSLEKEPRPKGVKKLSGELDLWRIRVGDHRMVYQIQDEVLTVLVVKIGHRRDIYR